MKKILLLALLIPVFGMADAQDYCIRGISWKLRLT